MAAPATRFRILFEPEKQNIPESIRLRRLLKYALRECGFRCVSVVNNTAPAQGAERQQSEVGSQRSV